MVPTPSLAGHAISTYYLRAEFDPKRTIPVAVAETFVEPRLIFGHACRTAEGHQIPTCNTKYR